MRDGICFVPLFGGLPVRPFIAHFHVGVAEFHGYDRIQRRADFLSYTQALSLARSFTRVDLRWIGLRKHPHRFERAVLVVHADFLLGIGLLSAWQIVGLAWVMYGQGLIQPTASIPLLIDQLGIPSTRQQSLVVTEAMS